MKNFPTRAPVGMLLGAILGLLSVVPVLILWHRVEPPLERFYFPQYFGSTLARTRVGAMISLLHSRTRIRRYFVLMQGGKPVIGAISPDLAQHLSVRFVHTTPRIFCTWLQNQIYGGREFRKVIQAPLVLWVTIGLALFLSGVGYDFERRKRAREGVPLRGPDLMTRRQFNQATKGDGFTLHVQA